MKGTKPESTSFQGLLAFGNASSFRTPAPFFADFPFTFKPLPTSARHRSFSRCGCPGLQSRGAYGHPRQHLGNGVLTGRPVHGKPQKSGAHWSASAALRAGGKARCSRREPWHLAWGRKLYRVASGRAKRGSGRQLMQLQTAAGSPSVPGHVEVCDELPDD